MSLRPIISIFCALVLIMCVVLPFVLCLGGFFVYLSVLTPKNKNLPKQPKKRGGGYEGSKKDRRGENGRKGLIVHPFAVPDMEINGKWCKSVIFLAPA